jgi:digeranylgeranylglycerophospholipid reductase
LCSVIDEPYDVVVVGASFAGLSFASSAAAHGMRVLVLERDPAVGGVVRTTGVLFSDVLALLDVPARYLLNAVRQIDIHVPGQPPIVVGGQVNRFFMADVTGMLRWMAEQACGHGVEIRCGAAFSDALREPSGLMRILYNARSGGEAAPSQEAVTARFLVGADGAHSQVARRLGLQQNGAFLAGAEWLVEGVPLEGDTFHLAMDHALAPGYCLWLAPHGQVAALGVAGHQRAFKPQASLQAAQSAFRDYLDMRKMRVVDRKGGVIPVGGRLRNVYRDDERGRALLLGDAAGLCGAATGGGIYPALVCGRLAAQAVATEVLDGVPGAVRAYLRDLPRANNLAHYLRMEDWLRWAMDRVGSNADLAAFYGVFTAAQGHAFLKRVLFETPITSMDAGLFAAMRQLLGRSPAVYGAALRGIWRRLTLRPGRQAALPQVASASDT